MKNCIYILTALLVLCMCIIYTITTETITSLIAFPVITCFVIYLECVVFDYIKAK